MVGGMSKVLKVDTENLTITCQAGCSWKQVYDAAWEKGMMLGSYPSSFPSATVAGWISTSGIGIGNYKYGSAGDNISSMTVVLPDGTIVKTGFDNVCDNMSGYNLNRLFVGAEGTLGVITEVTLKLVPKPEVLRPLAYAFESLDKLGAPLKDITRSRVQPLHIAWSDNNHFKYLKKIGKEVPEGASLLLITLEGDKDAVAYEEKVIDGIISKYGGKKEADELGQHEWDERCYEYRCNELGLGSIPGEVLVPISKFTDMSKDLYSLMDKMKMEGAIVGIMADRNTAMFMPYYLYDKGSMTKTMTSLSFDYEAGELAKSHGGRMVAGFGIFFGSLLKVVRGNGYVVEKGIKNVIDPNEIMNPGKLLGMKTRFGLPIGPGLLGFGMGAMVTVKKIRPKGQETLIRNP